MSTRTDWDVSRSATELSAWLANEPTLLGTDWLHALEARKQEEAAFHDSDREGHRDQSPESTPNRRFYQAATVIEERIQMWLTTQAPGARFLDYACGNGKMAIAAARAESAIAVGIDISATSVQNAAENAAQVGVAERTRFLQRDCENTGLPDASFDACLCSGMLHHLDLPRAFAELHRVMAPSGRILCVEALAYNPFIRMYRNRTPELRTAWEKDHILSMRDLHLAQTWFRVENVRFHMLTAPLATLLPNGSFRRAGIKVAHAIDAVMTRVPGIQRWSWMFSFELVRPE